MPEVALYVMQREALSAVGPDQYDGDAMFVGDHTTRYFRV
jgi:hypothetical protein